MDEETEIEFINIAMRSLEETLDLADRIYERAKSHGEHSEEFQKKKITFEIAKDVWDVSMGISTRTLSHFQKAFADYLSSKDGQIIKETIIEEFGPKIQKLYKKVNGDN